MSTYANANVPAGFLSPAPTSFTITNSTIAKVIVDTYPAAASGALTPQFYGGCTLLDLMATSTDGTARDVQLYKGTVQTIVGASTGACTTTTSTIPRSSGSFIADGWLVGDQVMVFAPVGTAPHAAVDGILGVITSVAALTLTLSGTPIAALALATGTRICKVTPKFRATIAANSGTTNALPAIPLLNHANDASKVAENDHQLPLGINNLLIASMPVAVSALPAAVTFDPVLALY